MQYKTITLELIQERPELYERAPEQQAVAAGDGRLRDRPESLPRGMDGTLERSEAGQRPEPDRRPKPWSWRSRSSGSICPPALQVTEDGPTLDGAMAYLPNVIRRPRSRGTPQRPGTPARARSPLTPRRGRSDAPSCRDSFLHGGP